MPPEMKRVFSSHVDAIGYEDGELWVQYRDRNGTTTTAVHMGVPPEVGNAVVGAPSVGSALHQMVRGRYDMRYVA